MSSRSLARPPGPLGAAVTGLLLVLAAVAVPLEAGQPLHLHESTSPGIYNEEHVLASLDSLSADAPLPDAPAAAAVAPVAAAGISAGSARLTAPVVSLADSRAPPLV